MLGRDAFTRRCSNWLPKQKRRNSARITRPPERTYDSHGTEMKAQCGTVYSGMTKTQFIDSLFGVGAVARKIGTAVRRRVRPRAVHCPELVPQIKTKSPRLQTCRLSKQRAVSTQQKHISITSGMLAFVLFPRVLPKTRSQLMFCFFPSSSVRDTLWHTWLVERVVCTWFVLSAAHFSSWEPIVCKFIMAHVSCCQKIRRPIDGQPLEFLHLVVQSSTVAVKTPAFNVDTGVSVRGAGLNYTFCRPP